MRILQYVPRIDANGGVPRFVLDIARVLAAQGHASTILAEDTTDTPQAWLDQSSNGPAEHDHRLPRVHRLGPPGIAGHFFAPHVMDIVRDQLADADVLHLHCVWSTTCMQIAAAAREIGVPYVVSLHGMLDDWCMHQRGLKKRVYLSLGGRYFLEKAARVHCAAMAEAEQSTKWFPHGHVGVIPYLVDLEPYRELPGPSLAESKFEFLKDYSRPTVLYLARLHYKHNPELLLHAAAKVFKRGLDFQLAIAGTGDPVYVGSIKRLAKELGIGHLAHFIGLVDGQEKTSLYEASDLFVLPTSEESRGLAFIESLACGTPIVTTRGVNIWRDVESSAAAAIIDPTTEALAVKLEYLLSNRHVIDAMAVKARPWALGQFDERRLVNRFEELYADAHRRATLSKPSPTPPNDLRASA